MGTAKIASEKVWSAPAPYPRLFRTNVLKLDGFWGVLFPCFLCRLALLDCSLYLLLFHGHRHPGRASWRDHRRVHCHNSSHNRVHGHCRDLPHGIHLYGRGLRHILLPGSCRGHDHDCRSLCCGCLVRYPGLRSRSKSRGIFELVEHVSLNNLTQTSSCFPCAGPSGAWDLTSWLRYHVKGICLFALFRRLRSILFFSPHSLELEVKRKGYSACTFKLLFILYKYKYEYEYEYEVPGTR